MEDEQRRRAAEAAAAARVLEQQKQKRAEAKSARARAQMLELHKARNKARVLKQLQNANNGAKGGGGGGRGGGDESPRVGNLFQAILPGLRFRERRPPSPLRCARLQSADYTGSMSK